MQNKIASVSNKKLMKRLTITGVMAALSSVLMFLDFPIALLFPTFLKFDFSDFPALMTSFLIGPVYGVTVELVKNVVHLFITTTGGVGELANFFVGASFVFCAGVIYKYRRTRKSALAGMIVGTIVMTVIAAFMNYFVTLPLYSKFMPVDQILEMCSVILPVKSKLGAVVIVFTPFNLLKGFVISAITLIVYKRVSSILKLK